MITSIQERLIVQAKKVKIAAIDNTECLRASSEAFVGKTGREPAIGLVLMNEMPGCSGARLPISQRSYGSADEYCQGVVHAAV